MSKEKLKDLQKAWRTITEENFERLQGNYKKGKQM